MTPANMLAICSILSVLLVAFIGAVWRLGSRVGGLQTLTDAAGATLRDVARACREMDERMTRAEARMGVLEGQWETTHRVVDKVIEIDKRVTAIESVCHERAEVSGRFDLEDGTVQSSCPAKGK